MSNLIFDDNETYCYDQVSEKVAQSQTLLDFLGYEVDREDGYFSLMTQQAISQFQKDSGINADGILNKETANELNSAVVRYWVTNRDNLDTQLQKAVEIVK